jgi:hypothetical protein
MVVQLPPQPASNTRLPPQPQNPATLDDVFNAVEYNSRIRASHSYIFINFLIVLCSLRSSRKCGKTTWCREWGHLCIWGYSRTCRSWYVVLAFSNAIVSHIIPALAPPWFAPALAAALHPLFTPLTRISYIVSFDYLLNGISLEHYK